MKKLLFVLPILAIATLLLAGCSKDSASIACTDEQKSAEVCTMDYTPVCGDDNMTYGSACSACASQNIASYEIWECVVDVCEDDAEVCAPVDPTQG